jgi:alpha-beta hydrolase superfamily lysophospholipase
MPCEMWRTVRDAAGSLKSRMLASLVLTLMSMNTSAAQATLIHETRSYPLGSVNLPVHYWRESTKKSKAVVIAVHGTTQHGGTFSRLGEDLAKQGIMTIAPDLRGHGRWYHHNVRQGKKAYYQQSVDDLKALLTSLRTRYPDAPIYCVGESVGSAVIIRAIADLPATTVNGVVLGAAGSSPCLFNPVRVVKDFCYGITDLERELDVRKYILDYSSEDAKVTHDMVTDPLARTMLSGKEILRTKFFIGKSPQFAKRVPANLPVLMVQGEMDNIVRSSSAEKILSLMPTKNKTLYTVKACGHVVIGTPYAKPVVIKTVTNWIAAQYESRDKSLLAAHKNDKASALP